MKTVEIDPDKVYLTMSFTAVELGVCVLLFAVAVIVYVWVKVSTR